MRRKKCVAMLLAGGQGSRLFALTDRLAKPAVSFGAKYRIIDFTLSNCINSDIDTVGVLTQYQPFMLNEYIGAGEPWDLDRFNGGVHMLSPYQAKEGGEWYKGTANAIYQNLYFIQKYNPEHILILSGDHIYKMDYSKMLDYHIEKNADCTIAVIDVPKKEASRFGIMAMDESGKIIDFEEKPKNPKSNSASMGVYIFKTQALIDELTADEKKPDSSNDFGKNVIPSMLNAHRPLYGYRFSGYWKDVGTITSLWEANMDLIGENPLLDLNQDEFKIFSRNLALPPVCVGSEGKIVNSIITAGGEINGLVENSIISEDVSIGSGAIVQNSVIMRGARIQSGARINYAIIDENVVIQENAQLGDENSNKERIVLVGRDAVILPKAKIESGKIVTKEDK